MRQGFRTLVLLGVLALAGALSGSAWAQTENGGEPAAGADTTAEDKAAARDLFGKGVTFFEKGDLERALDFFRQSQEAYPTFQNISNAAISLDKLGRYDEALELFELLLADYNDKFSAAEGASIGPLMGQLRKKVGTLDVSSNVDGSIVIDGRPRGTLPLRLPLRVLGGAHVVRIMKDGYATFEASVDAEVGKTAHLDARLEPLAAAGQLRIEDPENEGATVYIDGAAMGESPWEGTLGPGNHVVWAVKGDVGSAPIVAVVVQGQQSVIKIRSGPLGPPVQVQVQPATAIIRLGDVELGKARYSGRLPAGKYKLTAGEPGYFSQTRELDIAADPTSAAIEYNIQLEVDPDHPRWPSAASGHFWLGIHGGYAYTPSLNSGAQRNCIECPKTPGAHGGFGGLRGGYRFSFGTSLELSAGYLTLNSKFDRTTVLAAQPTVQYQLSDNILSHGPYVGVGASQRARFAERFGFTGRLMFGVMFARARDTISGTATGGGTDAADRGGWRRRNRYGDTAVPPDRGDVGRELRRFFHRPRRGRRAVFDQGPAARGSAHADPTRLPAWQSRRRRLRSFGHATRRRTSPRDDVRAHAATGDGLRILSAPQLAGWMRNR